MQAGVGKRQGPSARLSSNARHIFPEKLFQAGTASASSRRR